MIQIVLEHPIISFLGLCVVVDGIVSIVNNIFDKGETNGKRASFE